MLKGILWLLLLSVSCADNEEDAEGGQVDLNDPLAPHAWHLNNTGQTSFSLSRGIVGMDPKIAAVHAEGYSGEGVRIAVSDSGIESGHEDLDENLLVGEHRNYNLEKPWLGDSGDSKGHGTNVAGLLGAVGGNGIGSYGVAYNARVAGFFYVGIESVTVAKEIDQAGGNFDIFNYSYGLPSCSYSDMRNSYIDQLKYGTANYRDGKGAIYVKAAGNDWLDSLNVCDPSVDADSDSEDDYYFGNASLYYFHNWPYLIVVGALDAYGTSTSYSTPGSVLWISAPGGEFGILRPAMVTTDLSGCENGQSSKKKNAFDRGEDEKNADCRYTSTFNGTSSAAPVASGVIALMLEANNGLTWRDVKYILAKTAVHLDASIGNKDHVREERRLSGHTYMPDWVTNKAGFKFHNYYGFGGINAKGAVDMAKSYTSALGEFVESGWTDSNAISFDNTIPDASATGRSHILNVTTDRTIEMVQIELSVTHPRISDLGVELTSPGGTHSVIIPINSNISGSNMSGWILSSNAFYGENSQGNWTIKLIDGLSGQGGSLTRWKIKFFGY